MAQERKQRGLEIAATCKIDRASDGAWLVPSLSGQGRYRVRVAACITECSCECADHRESGDRCKHMYAVEYVMQREVSQEGSNDVMESMRFASTTRTTYGQNWTAYNAAQTNEKRLFQILLHSLCKDISNSPQASRGRRRLAMADVVFAVVYKTYSTVSARRFITDLCEARSKGFIDKVPHFNSIFNYLEHPEMSSILSNLITTSSAPLKSVECDFAVDSTGFMTSRFNRWYDKKYGVVRNDHDWVKAHLVCGVKTNIVTAVEIHERNTSDMPRLPSLLETTAKIFTIRQVSADKAYASADNFAAIDSLGATPYIPFKTHHTGAAGGLFAKAFHYSNFNREEFLAHYHKRSNVESTVNMIKAKFRDHVRSKTDSAMKNEVLCKVLCHNICCLIAASFELQLEPIFA